MPSKYFNNYDDYQCVKNRLNIDHHFRTFNLIVYQHNDCVEQKLDCDLAYNITEKLICDTKCKLRGLRYKSICMLKLISG